MDDKKKWVFKTAANDSLMASAIVKHMVDHGVKTVGFIGFSDAYGESWLTEIKAFAEQNKIKLAGVERFNPKDTSVTAQVLRVTASQPDAIIVAGSGTPAAMPQVALKETWLQGQDLSDPRRCHRRFPARGRQGTEWRLSAGRSESGVGTIAGQLRDQGRERQVRAFV